MSEKTCPHCSNKIPAELAVMPVCYICGGDLNATPSQPVWSSIDIKANNIRKCPSCSSEIKSVLAMECPNCKASLVPAGKVVEDIEKENKDFENLIKTSNQEVKSYPEMLKETQEKSTLDKEKPKTTKKQGFFYKLLKLFGLVKD